MPRTIWAESESKGIVNDERAVTHIRTDDGTISLWALPPKPTPAEIRQAGRQPGLVVLLRSARTWAQGLPEHLTGENVLLWEGVDNLEHALFQTDRDLGRLYGYFAALLPDGFATLDVAYTPDVSYLNQALLLKAVNDNLHPYRACHEDPISVDQPAPPA